MGKKVQRHKDKEGNLWLGSDDINEVLSENFAFLFTKEEDIKDNKIGVGYPNVLRQLLE